MMQPASDLVASKAVFTLTAALVGLDQYTLLAI